MEEEDGKCVWRRKPERQRPFIRRYWAITLQTTGNSYQPKFCTRSLEKCWEQVRSLAEFLCSSEIWPDHGWNSSFLHIYSVIYDELCLFKLLLPVSWAWSAIVLVYYSRFCCRTCSGQGTQSFHGYISLMFAETFINCIFNWGTCLICFPVRTWESQQTIEE